MKTVRPRPLAAPDKNLPLTAEEGFVLSRIDGVLSMQDLVVLTGLDGQRIETIVTKLASHGAVALEPYESEGEFQIAESSQVLPAEPAPSTTSLADFAAALGMDPSAFGGVPNRPVPEPEPTERDLTERAYASEDGESITSDPPPEDLAVEGEATPDAPAQGDEVAEEEAASEAKEQDYRKLYESKWHTLPTDARVLGGKTAHGADFSALCLDAETRVIAAILENPQVGLEQARLIAFHHRTTAGLEMLTRRVEFLRDQLVERRLLRNPMCGDLVLGRLMGQKRLLYIYKVIMDREIPEITRAKSRGHLKQKFGTAPADERADLVLRTEGRCLVYMTGCVFDSKTTSILCGRPYNSVLLIQNLARFSATPPGLLAHLMKQPFVRRHQPLKKLLLQHPNMPGDAKKL